MLVNPLFKDEDEDKPPSKQGQDYVFHNHKGKTIQPVSKDLHAAAPHARAINTQHHYPQAVVGSAAPASEPAGKSHADAAVELVRRKVAEAYGEEPAVKEELREVVEHLPHPSKHQQFMASLSTSGKSLAQIQTDWHDYYQKLPDQEKHEVWQEFYRANQHPAHTTGHATPKMPGVGAGRASMTARAEDRPRHQAVVRDHIPRSYSAKKYPKPRGTSAKIKKQILEKIALSANTQAKARQHFQSLAFGVVTGLIVLVVFLFGFFNEMFIAPFIQPSRHVSATPIILNSDSIAPNATPEVIIPKINVQIPTVYDQRSVNESDVQAGLERGVIHYPTTVLPGQQGNAAFFGHSSNNIFNKGKYKFAFVLLHELMPGDVFYLTYDKTVYSYRVFDKRIVPPTEVSVLDSVPGKPATATLITCDPPGTSTNRLVVWGEQISPDPAGAATPDEPTVGQEAAPAELPSEGPTMWKRFWGWLF
jgi:LPXTG-site transpeptidase (sortase) family protein